MYKSAETEKQNKKSKVGRIKMKVAKLPSYSVYLPSWPKKIVLVVDC